SFAFGLLKDDYRRTAETPASAPAITHVVPWLVNSRFTVQEGERVIYYASYTQGLEDSALAPISAINRGEPPIAARTWQVDAGVRYTPAEKIQFILGAFDIHKPYVNLDAANFYGDIGRLRNEGLETSLSYSNSGLTLLGGGVYLRPRV